MQIESQTLKLSANQNLGDFSDAKLKQIAHERLCWAMMRECSQVINLSCAEIIEIHGEGKGAHTAMLARQFETLMFEFSQSFDSSDACRVLWLAPSSNLELAKSSGQYCDIVVVCHATNQVRNILNTFDGFARIAARRDIGNNTALSIFGKNLARDVFKPKVRGELAA